MTEKKRGIPKSASQAASSQLDWVGHTEKKVKVSSQSIDEDKKIKI